jgi:hypothetical protein
MNTRFFVCLLFASFSLNAAQQIQAPNGPVRAAALWIKVEHRREELYDTLAYYGGKYVANQLNSHNEMNGPGASALKALREARHEYNENQFPPRLVPYCDALSEVDEWCCFPCRMLAAVYKKQ